MAIWQDANGKLHDDMGGAALLLPGWPAGLTQLTAAQAQALQNPAPTLAQARTAQIAQINASCQIVLAAILAPYPPAEVNTWNLQYNEAVAFTANALAPTPTISAIVSAAVAAGGTGYTVAAQAASILAKAAAYTAASGAAVGKRQSLTDKINAATTVATVQAIIW